VLENPRLCDAILAVDQFAAYYTKVRQEEGKSPRAALRDTLKHVYTYLREALYSRQGMSPNVGPLRWGDPFALADATEVRSTATDLLAWDTGWLPLEAQVSFSLSAGEVPQDYPAECAEKRLRLQVAPLSDRTNTGMG
jgi:hypothetical protein